MGKRRTASACNRPSELDNLPWIVLRVMIFQKSLLSCEIEWDVGKLQDFDLRKAECNA